MNDVLIPEGLDLEFKHLLGPVPRNFQPMKRLLPRHLHIISLHLQGLKGTEIVRLLESAGVYISAITVYRVLCDPLSQKVMENFYAGADREMKALELMAVDSLRSAMRSGSHRDAISAADKVFKANGRYGTAPSSISAEDVIARAMDAVKAHSDLVKEVVRERPRLIDIAPQSKVIEGDAV